MPPSVPPEHSAPDPTPMFVFFAVATVVAAAFG
jgi:hypothetical protein